MSDHSRPPPAAAHCPICNGTFPTIWAYKDHQDACLGRPGEPATVAEQAYLDAAEAADPRDPAAEEAENARMFRAEVVSP